MDKKNKIKKIIIEFGKIVAAIAAAVTIAQFLITLNNNQVEEQRRLLQCAEEYYEEGNYEAVADILSNDKLENNKLIPLNIGVMYAKGYYFKRDEKRAFEYFREAFENGEKYYSIQYLLYYLKPTEDSEEIKELVLAGCNNNNLYLEKLLEMLYAECELECEEKFIENFKTKSDNEQEVILNKLFAKVGENNYDVATGYKYVVYEDEEGEQKVEATITSVEERIIDIYIKNYLGIEDIKMIFVN